MFSQNKPSIFGTPTTNTNAFGSTSGFTSTNTTAFGQPAQQTSLFGGTNTGFCAPSNTSLFGTQQSTFFNASTPAPQSTTFGSTGAGLPFGTTSSLFGGAANTGVTNTQSLFGTRYGTTAPAFGTNPGASTSLQPSVVGTTIKFNPLLGTDTMIKNNVNTSINTRHQCLTCMKEYENKSLEELRWEDYQANRKGPQTSFGATSGTSIFSTPQTSAVPPFSSDSSAFMFGTAKPAFGTTAATTTTSVFSPASFKPPAFSSGFGGTSALGTFSTNTQTPAQSNAIFPTNTFASTNFFATTTANQTKPAFGNTSTTQSFNAQFGGANQTRPLSFGTSSMTSFGTPSTTLSFAPSTTTSLSFFNNNVFNNNSNLNATPSKHMFNYPSQPLTGQTSLGSGLSNNFNTGNIFGNTQNTNLFNSQNTTGYLFSNPLQTTQTQMSPFSLQQNPQAQSPASELLLSRLQTMPYGDSPLFQNNVSTSQSPSLKFSTDPKTLYQYKVNAKSSSNTKIPRSSSVGQMNTSLLFDGLEEDNPEDKKTAFDIFVPRQNLKRLVLKPRDSLNLSNLTPNNITSSPNNIATPPSNQKQLNPSSKENIVNSTVLELINSKNSPNITLPSINTSDVSKTSSLSADENSLVTQHNAPELKCRVVLTKPDYYTIPPLDQLDEYFDADMKTCIVNDFTVGREWYGSVYWEGPIDIYNLNLDEMVHIRRKEVIVFPNDEGKPPIGEGLNRPAQITLHQVWPVDRSSRKVIKDINRLKSMKYAERIEMATIKLDAIFKEYRPDTGSWVFQVKHFSKYGFNEEENDEDNKEIETKENTPPQEIVNKDFQQSKWINMDVDNSPKENSFFQDQDKNDSFIGHGLVQKTFAEKDTETEPTQNVLSNYYDSMRYALFRNEEDDDFRVTFPSLLKKKKTQLISDIDVKSKYTTAITYAPKICSVQKRQLILEPDIYPLMNKSIIDINSICSTVGSKARFFNGSSKFTQISGNSVIIYNFHLIPDVSNHLDRFDTQFKYNSILTSHSVKMPFIHTKPLARNKYNSARLEKLVDAFFGPLTEITTYGKEQERINRVIDWLSERNELIKKPTKTVQKILYYLCCNNIRAAVDEAIESRQPKLALLIACGNNFSTRACLIKQLESWKGSGSDYFIDPDLLKLYVLLSGNFCWTTSGGQEIDVRKGLAWTQQLNLMLLFATLQSFEDCINNLTSPTDDVEYHLLAQSSPFKALSSASNEMEAWFLHESLESYNVIKDKSKSDFLHSIVCSQLISQNLITTCFIALHIRDDDLRESTICEAITLNASKMNEEDVKYLVENFFIPLPLIRRLEAIYYRSVFDYRKQAICLLNGEDWVGAHDVLVDKIFPELVINEDHDELRTLISRLKEHRDVIANWYSSGGHLYDFYVTYITLENNDCVKSLYDLESFNIHHLNCKSPRHVLCQSEMARKINLLTLSYRGGIFPLNSPIPNDYVLKELNHNCRQLLKEYIG